MRIFIRAHLLLVVFLLLISPVFIDCSMIFRVSAQGLSQTDIEAINGWPNWVPTSSGSSTTTTLHRR